MRSLTNFSNIGSICLFNLFLDCYGVAPSIETFSKKKRREFSDDLDWLWISETQSLTDEFTRKFANKLDWFLLSKNTKNHLSPAIVREYPNKFDWHELSKRDDLQEEIIREFPDKVDWYELSKNKKKFSDEFYLEFHSKLMH